MMRKSIEEDLPGILLVNIRRVHMTTFQWFPNNLTNQWYKSLFVENGTQVKRNEN